MARQEKRSTAQRFAGQVAKDVGLALKELLTTKHLYQSIEVESPALPALAKAIDRLSPSKTTKQLFRPGTQPTALVFPPAPDPVTFLLNQATALLSKPWVIEGLDNPAEQPLVVGEIVFPYLSLPTINTYCNVCGSSPPFNPDLKGASGIYDNDQNHSYYFSYLCQQCKAFKVRFMVRREAKKLRLVGRDPIEAIPTPREIPKAFSKYYGDALIAHHAGQTLAAIFLLRVLIEQYWRSVPAIRDLVAREPRATGEEQGALYQDTLPEDFRSRFPSLSEIYRKLSSAMHEARADATLFEDSISKTFEHFEARRVYRLDQPQ